MILTQEEFNSQVSKYYELKEQADEIMKFIKPMNDAIKRYMAEHETSNLLLENGYKVVIGVQNRSKVDNDKLVYILKEHGFTNAIKQVEIPDEKEVEKLVYLEQLSKEDYLKAVHENYIQTLKVVKK